MIDALEARARRLRERALVRSWEFRQRHNSKGVWYRLRRTLADAAEAWSVSEEDADRLEQRGHLPLRVGKELDPPKRLFFLSRAELQLLFHRTPVPVRLTQPLLEARCLVLIAHADTGGPVPARGAGAPQ